VSARIQATFEDRGVPSLKNIPRRITTFAVHSADRLSDTDMGIPSLPLDNTMQLPRAGSLTAAAAAAEAKKAPDVPPKSAHPAAVEKTPVEKSAAVEKTAEVANTAPLAKNNPSLLEQTIADPDPLATPTARHPPLVPPAPPSPRQPPVPARSAPPTSRPVTAQPPPPSAAVTIPAQAIDEIIEALAVHLGPVARLMVNRKSKTATSTSELIETLAGELASSDERAKFRTRLIRLIGR